jgi:hypothetical protein
VVSRGGLDRRGRYHRAVETHRHHTVAATSALLAVLAGCAGAGEAEPVLEPAPTTAAASTSTEAPASTSSTAATTTEVATTTIRSTTTTLAPTVAPEPTAVTAPGTYAAPELTIHLSFRSEVDDVTSRELETFAMATLSDARSWGPSGFSFVVDAASDLTVVLAEPVRVDELCLPLETRGFASCQNGPIVAFNAQRWRTATDDWDASVDDYRRYLVNHEVGHLIGLRHPVDRCPDGQAMSAVMEPQTAGLVCSGNSWPLTWEIEWARRRPAVVGPLPEWDGPHPTWPPALG